MSLEKVVFVNQEGNIMRVITGTARSKKLITPKGSDVRPTTDMVKEAVFSAVQFEIEGAAVLDLFAGSGQIGIEALSRGAKSAVFVDKNRDAIAAVKENLKTTQLAEKAKVLLTDSLAFLKSTGEQFDFVFLDPPYEQGICQQALPLAVQAASETCVIFCETRKQEELPEEVGDFRLKKTYRYGKIKLTQYRRKGE